MSMSSTTQNDTGRGGKNRQAAQNPASDPENRKLPMQVDGCLSLVTKCLLDGDTDSADMWLDIMARELPGSSNKAFFHKLIHACAKSGSPNAAGWCAVRMVRAGLQPNKVTFNSVIDACAKVGQVELAAKWWEEMTEIGLKPNAITYNTMINACSQARDAEHAEWWMQKMLKDNITPCTVTFSTVIDAFAKIGRLNKAERWFAKMSEAGVQPDAVIYNSLINACAKAGNPSKAEYWLLQMQIANLVPDEKTYNSLINACAKAGATERAEHWFKHMERTGCRVDKITFGSVIHASAKIGNVERAEYWLEEMIARGMTPNLVCFNTVLHACAHNGDTARARAWLHKILAAGIDPNKITHNSMIHAYAKAGDAASAEAWLQQMIAKGYHPDQITYVTLLRACANLGEEFDPKEFSRWTYGTIVKAYAHVGSISGMKRWLGDMTRAGIKPSSELCEEIIEICSKKVQEKGKHQLGAQVAKMLAPHIDNDEPSQKPKQRRPAEDQLQTLMTNNYSAVQLPPSRPMQSQALPSQMQPPMQPQMQQHAMPAQLQNQTFPPQRQHMRETPQVQMTNAYPSQSMMQNARTSGAVYDQRQNNLQRGMPSNAQAPLAAGLVTPKGASPAVQPSPQDMLLLQRALLSMGLNQGSGMSVSTLAPLLEQALNLSRQQPHQDPAVHQQQAIPQRGMNPGNVDSPPYLREDLVLEHMSL